MKKIPKVEYLEKDYLKELINNLRESGACILTNFYQNEQIKQLYLLGENATREEYLLEKNYKKGKLYTLHNNKNFLNLKSIFYQLFKKKSFPNIKRLIINHKIKHSPEIKALNKLLLFLKYSIYYSYNSSNSIYITYDNKDTSHSAQKPHFDWRPCLKGMIYLNNCENKNNGGLYYLPKSHKRNSFLFSKERLNGNLPGLKDADNYFNESEFSKNDFCYTGSKKGDILIFNTDGFHYQGKNKLKTYNKIIRIHSYLHDINIYGS